MKKTRPDVSQGNLTKPLAIPKLHKWPWRKKKNERKFPNSSFEACITAMPKLDKNSTHKKKMQLD